MARKKNPPKRNYYRNSAARRRARRIGRLKFALKAVFGLLVLAATSFMFIFGYDYLTQCEYFEARQIGISGNDRLSSGEVLSRANLSPGVNILSLNLFVVRKRLLADPWIAEAEVSRELPDSIQIRVKERRPVAILDLGRKFLLDEKGEIFKELEGEPLTALPLVAGLEFTDLHLDGKDGSPVFDAVLEVLHLSRRPDSALPIEAIRRIDVDRQLGLTLHAFNRHSVIKIGFSNYPVKYDRLRSVMRFLNRDRRLAEFSTIDLNQEGRVVITPAQLNFPEKEHEEV